MIDLGRERLSFLGASFHWGQVKSEENFLNKALEFSKKKDIKTRFKIMSVLTEENFETLKSLRSKLVENGIDFSFQHLKVNGRLYKYSDEINKFLHEKNLSANQYRIFDKKTYGTICLAGINACIIEENGDVKRCYNSRQEMHHLGNITNGLFKFLRRPIPCLAESCSCALFPANGIIRYGNYDLNLANKLKTLSRICKKIHNEIKEICGIDCDLGKV